MAQQVALLKSNRQISRNGAKALRRKKNQDR
jgi:hypothetical protein